ncbi:MAG TPA: sulfite dehydrogenase [Candidatus Saccharimonadales bacterium]|jgi:sulfane dehydrogenase subunit SoxC|nr:sulfite dehydrogenase [Candidatus Saccharimonadales bacterium]
MNPKKPTRRLFLKNGAALAGLALGAPAVAKSVEGADAPLERVDQLHQHGERSHFVDSIRHGSINNPERHLPDEPRAFGLTSPIQDSSGMVTPASLHFVISHGYEPPDINPKEHRLLIHGMVDRPMTLSVDDIKRLPSVSKFHFIECHGNSTTGGLGGPQRVSPDATAQDTHGYTSCSQWTGVMLSLILEQAGLQKSGTWIVAEGADDYKHSKSIPIGKAMDDALVAYAQNGEPVRPEQGFPLRLVVPGFQGINNVKWLHRINVVDEPYMGMMEVTRYPRLMPDGKSRWFEFELGPKSVITRPSGGHHLQGPGFYEITGLAWSGGGTIRRVEVSTDGGKIWKDAKMQDPILRKAHTRFTIPWNWDGGEAMLMSRCTDDNGVVQPSLAEVAKIWGTDPDFFKKTTLITSDMNAIQPWKVNADGSIKNAIF